MPDDEDPSDFQGAFPVEPDIHMPHKNVKRDTPVRWLVQSWREIKHIFTEPRMSHLKARVQEKLAITDEEVEEYFEKLQKSIEKINWKQAMENEMSKEKSAAQDETTKLFKMRLTKALKYSVEHQPPITISPLLSDLSDNILHKLADMHHIQPPGRNSLEKDSVFLLLISDWAAKLIHNIYTQMAVIEKEDSCMKLTHEVSSKLSMTDWESGSSDEEDAQPKESKEAPDEEEPPLPARLTTGKSVAIFDTVSEIEASLNEYGDDEDETPYDGSALNLSKSYKDLEKNFKRIFAGIEPGFRHNTPVMESSMRLASRAALPTIKDDGGQLAPQASTVLSKPSHLSMSRLLSSVTNFDDSDDDDDDDDEDDDDDDAVNGNTPEKLVAQYELSPEEPKIPIIAQSGPFTIHTDDFPPDSSSEESPGASLEVAPEVSVVLPAPASVHTSLHSLIPESAHGSRLAMHLVSPLPSPQISSHMPRRTPPEQSSGASRPPTPASREATPTISQKASPYASERAAPEESSRASHPPTPASREATPTISQKASPYVSERAEPEESSRASRLPTPASTREATPTISQKASPYASERAAPEESSRASHPPTPASREATPTISQKASPYVSERAEPEESSRASRLPTPASTREATPTISQKASPYASERAAPQESSRASRPLTPASEEATPTILQKASPYASERTPPPVQPQALPKGSRSGSPPSTPATTPTISQIESPYASQRGPIPVQPQALSNGSRPGSPPPSPANTPTISRRTSSHASQQTLPQVSPKTSRPGTPRPNE